MGFNITSLSMYVLYLFYPIKINLEEAMISVSGCRKHSHTGNTRNARPPESPGVSAGRCPDLLNQPYSKAKENSLFSLYAYNYSQL